KPCNLKHSNGVNFLIRLSPPFSTNTFAESVRAKTVGAKPFEEYTLLFFSFSLCNTFGISKSLIILSLFVIYFFFSYVLIFFLFIFFFSFVMIFIFYKFLLLYLFL